MLLMRIVQRRICHPYRSALFFSDSRHYSLSRAVNPSRDTVVRVVAAAKSSKAPASQSFKDLGISRELQDALASQQLVQPTEIQALAVPALLQKGDFQIASHTGSGKTLAYLLPLVQKLKQDEAAGHVPAIKRPRALILAPTKELSEQITRVAKTLSHFAKFRGVGLNVHGMKEQKEKLGSPVDLVVATPNKVLQHMKMNHVHLRDVKWLVIDEADTMFDRGFGEEVRQLLLTLKGKSTPVEVVLVSATMTKAVRRVVKEHLPGLKSIETSSLHKGVVGSRHGFSSVPPGGNKVDLLLEILEVEVRKNKKVLVFCNTMDSCRAVEHRCREQDIATVCYHGDMPLPQRKEAINMFAGHGQHQDDKAAVPVMVCTDLAARGLDFPFRVDHVINFDFPKTPIDYLHRSGRTARAGQPGQVTSILFKSERILANRIEYALAHNEPLDQLSNKKEVLPPSQRPLQPSRTRVAQKVKIIGRKGLRASGPGKSGDKSSRQTGTKVRGPSKVGAKPTRQTGSRGQSSGLSASGGARIAKSLTGARKGQKARGPAPARAASSGGRASKVKGPIRKR